MQNSKFTDIYQHFKKDEQVFIDKMIEWKQRVEESYIPFVTPFLTPREQFMIQTLFTKSDTVRLFLFGGVSSPERQRACLTIAEDVTELDFNLDCYRIRYPKKFATLKHSQILGSVLGAGVKKEYIGDIITNNGEWQIIVDRQIGQYLQRHIDKIGSISVTFEHILLSDLLVPNNQAKEVFETVSSLRLDTLLAKAFGLSRQRVKEFVESGHVSINWKEETRATIDIKEKDVVSLRKYGRVTLEKIEGYTKKGKFRVLLKLLKNHDK